MAVMIGAHPGGRNKYAISALYFPGQLPALAFKAHSFSGTDEVLGAIVGTYGEWGELATVAIDAPLTWSGDASGWRGCDHSARAEAPTWVPKTWIRPPNTLSGATAVQGPALAWALAQEIKNGILPKHQLFETHARLCLSRIAAHHRQAVLGYRDRKSTAAQRREHVTTLLASLTEAGVLRIEDDPPETPEELDALVSALVALANAHPECGLVAKNWPGGEIRPVGKRSLSLLYGLP